MTKKLFIDAENSVAGRLASYAAKLALQGNKVIIMNCEKAIVSGRKENIIERYRKKRARGGYIIKGPFFPSNPERILKRTIRGMLSYKEKRGREAFKNIICYNSVPKEFENEKMIKFGEGKKGITLKEISNIMKGK